LTSVTPVRADGSGPDYAALSKFGQIVTLTESSDNVVNDSPFISKQIRERLIGYDPRIDYMVWAGGDPLAAVLVGAILGKMGFNHIKWLRFDRLINPETGRRMTWKGNYMPVQITL